VVHLMPRTASLQQAGGLHRMTLRGHTKPIKKVRFGHALGDATGAHKAHWKGARGALGVFVWGLGPWPWWSEACGAWLACKRSVVLVKKVWQLLRQLPQQVGRTGVHAAGCGLSGCKATV